MISTGRLTTAEVQVWHGVVNHGAADHGAADHGAADHGAADHGVAGQGPPAGDLEILSAAERARCERFVRPADRVRFAVTHAAVRRVLAGYLGTGPAEIRFGRVRCCGCGDAGHGPPRIDWPATDLAFSLSRSADHWALAVGRGRPLGVDIEVPRAVNVTELAGACLTQAEQDCLAAAPEPDRPRLFYRCWTRKEAVLKACGLGLAGPMSALDTQPGTTGPAEVAHACPAGPGRWLVQDLPVPTGSPWLGAIAQPAGEAALINLRAAG
jgi:4'-phosphopantetheinyl transferase